MKIKLSKLKEVFKTQNINEGIFALIKQFLALKSDSNKLEKSIAFKEAEIIRIQKEIDKIDDRIKEITKDAQGKYTPEQRKALSKQYGMPFFG